MIPPPDHPLSAPPAEKREPASAKVRTHIRESLSPLTRGFGLAL